MGFSMEMVAPRLWRSLLVWLLVNFGALTDNGYFTLNGTLVARDYSHGQFGGAMKCVCSGRVRMYGFGGGAP